MYSLRSQCGCIAVNDGSNWAPEFPYVDLPEDHITITDAQYKALEDYLYYLIYNNLRVVEVKITGRRLHRYAFPTLEDENDGFPEKIIKDIKIKRIIV